MKSGSGEVWFGYWRLFGRLGGFLLFPLLAPFLFLVWVLAKFIEGGKLPTNESATGMSPPSSEKPDDVGTVGITLTDLRPEGKIEINGRVYNARSTQGFLGKDREVEVTEVLPSGERKVTPSSGLAKKSGE